MILLAEDFLRDFDSLFFCLDVDVTAEFAVVVLSLLSRGDARLGSGRLIPVVVALATGDSMESVAT